MFKEHRCNECKCFPSFAEESRGCMCWCDCHEEFDKKQKRISRQSARKIEVVEEIQARVESLIELSQKLEFADKSQQWQKIGDEIVKMMNSIRTNLEVCGYSDAPRED